MRYQKSLACLAAFAVGTAVIVFAAAAQDKSAPKPSDKPATEPSEAEMIAMMVELAKPGDNHKLLASGVGTWTYTAKMWMNPDPNAAPSESSGTAVTKEVMEGRYFVSEHTGKIPWPGPDGKMTEVEFKGMAVEGYDNVKKKFVSSWIDNMGTGIMLSEGTYNSATKSFTYTTEHMMIPGVTTKIKEVITIKDKNNRTFEFFEDRGGTEVRTMEIKYTRKS